MPKKNIETIEEKDVENAVTHLVPDGSVLKTTYYFDALNETYLPENEYDVVIYKISDRPRYLIGTAASRARQALKPAGLFVVDYSGFVTNLNEVRIISEFEGLIFVNHDSKNGVMVFRKPDVGEKHEINIDVDMVE